MFINWHGTCIFAIFHRQIDLKRSQRDTGWSRGSWTPSATLTSSTMVSAASTSYVHQKLTWHMFKCYYSKTNRFKTVPAWYRVIKRLTDTLSDLVKLNHGELSKYLWCPSKIDMAHIYKLFFKDKSIQNGSKVILEILDTLSDLDKLNYTEYSKYQLCSSKI